MMDVGVLEVTGCPASITALDLGPVGFTQVAVVILVLEELGTHPPAGVTACIVLQTGVFLQTTLDILPPE